MYAAVLAIIGPTDMEGDTSDYDHYEDDQDLPRPARAIRLFGVTVSRISSGKIITHYLQDRTGSRENLLIENSDSEEDDRNVIAEHGKGGGQLAGRLVMGLVVLVIATALFTGMVNTHSKHIFYETVEYKNNTADGVRKTEQDNQRAAEDMKNSVENELITKSPSEQLFT